MKQKRYYIFIGLFITFLCFLRTYQSISMYTDNIAYLYIEVFSKLDIKSRNIIPPIITLILHNVLVIYVFRSYIKDECLKHGIYIFTRTNKRQLWILKHYKKIIIDLVIYYLSQFMFLFLISNLYGFTIHSVNEFLKVFVLCLVMTILSSYMFILLTNLISIVLDELYAYIITLVSIISNLILLYMFYNFNEGSYIMKYMPFSQHIVNLHEIHIIDLSIVPLNFFIKGYSIKVSLFYMVICIIILILMSMARVRNLEIY